MSLINISNISLSDSFNFPITISNEKGNSFLAGCFFAIATLWMAFTFATQQNIRRRRIIRPLPPPSPPKKILIKEPEWIKQLAVRQHH